MSYIPTLCFPLPGFFVIENGVFVDYRLIGRRLAAPLHEKGR